MANHVFICYRSTDRAYVEKLATHLRAAGVAVWYDADSRAGERFDREIKKQIDTCAAFIVVMTPEAGDSDWVTAEVDLAQSLKKEILPLLLRGRDRFERSDMFFSLRATQYDDVSGGELPDTIVERLRQLGVAVSTLAPASRKPAVVPARAGLAPVASIGAALAVLLVAGGLWALVNRPLKPGPTAYVGILIGDGPGAALAWSHDGSRLATTSDNVIIWDATTGQRIRTIAGTGSMNGVTWSPDGSRLATGSDDETAIWNVTTGDKIHTLDNTSAMVTWSPDGSRLATAAYNKTAVIWDATSGDKIRTLTGHTRDVARLAWSPDGSRLATASIDGTVIIWDATTGDKIRTLGLAGVAVGMAWSSDGTLLNTADVDGTVIIWRATTGNKIRTVTLTAFLHMAAWSPNGTRLATANVDGTVIIWDATTGDRIRTITDYTNSVAWSPDGGRLATASYDNTIGIWAV